LPTDTGQKRELPTDTGQKRELPTDPGQKRDVPTDTGQNNGIQLRLPGVGDVAKVVGGQQRKSAMRDGRSRQ